MKPIYSVFYFLLSLPILSLHAQQGSINGKVSDYEGAALSYANVVLYAAQDSTVAKVEMTGEDGSFMLPGIDQGIYYLSVHYAGLPQYVGETFEFGQDKEINIGEIKMAAPSNELQEVKVTARRPIVELKSDRTVFNVKGSINATGYNALELLRKSPGVVVDNNNNISILGKNGVIVYIDGKQSPLTGADLASYLENLQSTQIDAIEVITNPSSKYDAQGNAGIINIKLVKDQNIGTHGTVNANFRQGKYASGTGGISMNHRNKKINVFGSLDGNIGNAYNSNHFDRYSDGALIVTDFFGRQEWKGFSYRGGVDFFTSDKTTLGVLVNGNTSRTDFSSKSTSVLGKEAEATIDSILRSRTTTEGTRNNTNYNFNISHAFDESSSLNVDLDYGAFRITSEQNQPNRYFDVNDQLLSKNDFYTESPTNIDIYTFKADYSRPLLDGSLDMGTKFSKVTTDNDFRFFNVMDDGDRVLNADQTNRFIYDEMVYAGYFNFSQQLNDKVSFNVGLRMESTKSMGDLTALDDAQNRKVDRSYTDWFPSFGLSYNMNQKNTFTLSYSRRLNRPSYQDLNPFLFRIDEITYMQGNSFLNPEYSQNIQLTHSFNYKLNTTLSFTRTTDMIARVLDRDASNPNIQFISFYNLDAQNHYSLGLSSPTSITDWWSSFVNLSFYYVQNESDFSEGRRIDVDAFAYNAFAQQTFTLSQNTSLELSGWYNSPAIWEGNFETNSQGALDIGIQQKIMQNKGNLKVTVTDLFKTAPWGGMTTLGEGFSMVGGGEWDSRQLRVAFTYNFGNEKIKSRKRKTGLEDEKSRVKN